MQSLEHVFLLLSLSCVCVCVCFFFFLGGGGGGGCRFFSACFCLGGFDWLVRARYASGSRADTHAE